MANNSYFFELSIAKSSVERIFHFFIMNNKMSIMMLFKTFKFYFI